MKQRARSLLVGVGPGKRDGRQRERHAGGLDGQRFRRKEGQRFSAGGERKGQHQSRDAGAQHGAIVVVVAVVVVVVNIVIVIVTVRIHRARPRGAWRARRQARIETCAPHRFHCSRQHLGGRGQREGALAKIEPQARDARNPVECAPNLGLLDRAVHAGDSIPRGAGSGGGVGAGLDAGDLVHAGI